MRKWDEDGMPDPDAVAFGEFIIKVRAAAPVDKGRWAQAQALQIAR